jgi:hypothetical protein
MNPLRRLGTPEGAAQAVLFLCSPLSDYVTGEVLVCSGAMHFYKGSDRLLHGVRRNGLSFFVDVDRRPVETDGREPV